MSSRRIAKQAASSISSAARLSRRNKNLGFTKNRSFHEFAAAAEDRPEPHLSEENYERRNNRNAHATLYTRLSPSPLAPPVTDELPADSLQLSKALKYEISSECRFKHLPAAAAAALSHSNSQSAVSFSFTDSQLSLAGNFDNSTFNARTGSVGRVTPLLLDAIPPPVSEMLFRRRVTSVRRPYASREVHTKEGRLYDVHPSSRSSGAGAAGSRTDDPPELPGATVPHQHQQFRTLIREVSAADCDEAVEDLDEVRARAKAANEAVRKGEGVLRAAYLLALAVLTRTWNLVSSVGPFVGSVARMSAADWRRTLSGWNKVLREAVHHYWVGSKLLWADIRISSRLLLKLSSGRTLSRRERQQLTRTSADIFRLVPFAVFVIVPFMEFLLPVFLRFFPNMLPSTFQDKLKEEEKVKRRIKARLEMARFLQDTVSEMAKEVLEKERSGEWEGGEGGKSGGREGVSETAGKLKSFMAKVRTGGSVSNEEIVRFARLFNDELTLDNMSRPRLISMCKYMGLTPYGTDSYLRYVLRSKLAWIKEDDKLIQREGIDTLSESELRAALRERGMLGLLSVEEMRQQLRDWLDLSLNRAMPSSLLILSRAFLVSGLMGKSSLEDVMQATLSSLPNELVESVSQKEDKEREEEREEEREAVRAVVEGAERQGEKERRVKSESERKLELLREEERLIKEEEARALEEEKLEKTRAKERAREREEQLKETATLLKEREGEEIGEKERGKVREEERIFEEPGGEEREKRGAVEEVERIEEEMVSSSLRSLAQSKAREKREELCKLSAALAILASSSSVAKERSDFLSLVNKEISLYNRMVDLKGKEGEEEAREAYYNATKKLRVTATAEKPSEGKKEGAKEGAKDSATSRLINKIDSILLKLEKELDAAEISIGKKLKVLDLDSDGKVTAEEVSSAANLLRDKLSQESLQQLIENLAKDSDGKILVEDILRLGTLADSTQGERTEEEVEGEKEGAGDVLREDGTLPSKGKK